MVVWDTETTGLVKPSDVPLVEQPSIIEFAAIKLNDATLKEENRLTYFCDPGIELDATITKITGITNKLLKEQKAKPFIANLQVTAAFFLGQQSMAAHNLAFDRAMLYHELLRLDLVTKFPWPMKHICTVEASYPIKNHRLNLTKLHELATGKPFAGAHRAMVDVEALCVCIRWLRKGGYV